MYVSTSVNSAVPDNNAESPRTGVTDTYKLSNVCWEWNYSPLQSSLCPQFGFLGSSFLPNTKITCKAQKDCLKHENM